MTTSRRQFLKYAGALGGTATALTGMNPLLRKAMAIEANNETGTIHDVKHVVILMQENRSFDHYYGTFPGVRGFSDRFPIPLPDTLLSKNRNVWQQRNLFREVYPYHLDEDKGNAHRVAGTPHDWNDAQNAWDNGKLSQWPRYKFNHSMGHYERKELGFYFELANAFTICDHYHCSLHGGTNSNRLFFWTGSNGPDDHKVAVTNHWDSLGGSDKGYEWTTYPERLESKGVSWKIYQNLPDNFGDNALAGFKQYRRAYEAMKSAESGNDNVPYDHAKHNAIDPLIKGTSNTMPDGGFLASFVDDVRNDRLPEVSWILAPEAYSEHPSPSSTVQGAWYTQEILSALVENPDVFSKTVFLINYDENDGFFDHLPPPCPPSRSDLFGTIVHGKTTLSKNEMDIDYYNKPPEHIAYQTDGKPYGPGPRVPMLVISPWSRGGWVNSQVFDHTSVLRFLEARFDVAEANISPYRRAVCGDLTSCFDFKKPNTTNYQQMFDALPQRTKEEADALRVAQQFKLAVPIPSDQAAPQQEQIVRHARAIPYDLNTIAQVENNAVNIQFLNTGEVGAVFHVYDKLNLNAIPKRYMVEAGKTLDDTWKTHFGKYDLWLLSTNGFHRRIAGNANQSVLDATCRYDVSSGKLIVTLTNGANDAQTVNLDNRYLKNTPVQSVNIDANAKRDIAIDIANTEFWYDIVIDGLANDDTWQRHFAGHIENGEDGISEPPLRYFHPDTANPPSNMPFRDSFE